MLNKKNIRIKELQKELRVAGIEMVLHPNKEGIIDGVTYIDYNTKAVFNDSSLDQAYSVKALQERVSAIRILHEKPIQKELLQLSGENKATSKKVFPLWKIESVEIAAYCTPYLSNKENCSSGKLIEILSQQECGNAIGAYELDDKRRRKKVKKITL